MERTSHRSQRAVPIALIAIAAVLLAARIVSQLIETPDGPDLVRWVAPEEGQRLARESGKPILYNFTAEWCAPCHVLKDEVFRDRALAEEINRRFVPVEVVDRQQEEGRNTPIVAELERRYSVRGFPTIVFADAAGVQRARMEGYRGRAEFERLMERVR